MDLRGQRNLHNLNVEWRDALASRYAAFGQGAASRGPRVALRVHGTVRIRIRFDQTREFARLAGSVGRMAQNKEVLGQLIRQAAIETVVQAIRERFILNLPNVLEVETKWIENPDDGNFDSRNVDKETGAFSGGYSARARNTKEMLRVRELYKALDKNRKVRSRAQSENALRRNARARGNLYKRLASARKLFRKSLNRSRTGGNRYITPHRLSSGKFRPMALRALALLTDSGWVRFSVTNDRTTVGIGNLRRASGLRTPSATEQVLKKGATSSPFTMMWRHLEFGTGVYSQDPDGSRHPATPYSAFGGGWWYDRNPPGGLYVRGARGVHALFKERSRELRESDEQAFFEATSRLLTAYVMHGKLR